MAFFAQFGAAGGGGGGITQAQVEAAIRDVFPTNILDQDIHDAAAVTINANSGAFVAFGAGITIPATTKAVQVSSTIGEPIQISFASALGGAAASALQIYLVPGGAPGTIPFIPSTSNLAFVRSLSANSVTDGYLTLNFVG